MVHTSTISKTDLARRTRQVVDRARRGDTLIVESYGEEQVVVMDAADYRILRAVAAYQTLSPHPAPVNDPTLEPAGLSEFHQWVHRAGEVPVDEGNRESVACHYIPGSHVAVSDDPVRTAEGTTEPGPPYRIRRWAVGGGRLVQIPKQFTHRGCSLQCPRAGLRELALDVTERLAALRVVPRTHHARRPVEAHVLEVAQ